MKSIEALKETEIKRIVDEAVKIIRSYLSQKDYTILFFGSWATIKALPTSDIDIAILGKNRVDDFILIKIKEEIENLPTLRSIDIVDLNTFDERSREKILRYAEVID